VDLSAPNILGEHIVSNPADRRILYDLAASRSLWERRVAVVSTFALIRKGQFSDSLKMAVMLLKDKHDASDNKVVRHAMRHRSHEHLIHKAVGWMLREVGKRDETVLRLFLDKHRKAMPRTMLRYAMERLPEKERKRYMAR